MDWGTPKQILIFIKLQIVLNLYVVNKLKNETLIDNLKRLLNCSHLQKKRMS